MAEKLVDIIKKPKELLGGAIKAIKGPDVQQLVETFTSEMTVVVEGLYDDQMRLRKEVEALSLSQEGLSRELIDSREETEAKCEQSLKDLATRMADLQKRIQTLETNKGKQTKKNGILTQMTVLAAIVAGAWIIVTLLNLLK